MDRSNGGGAAERELRAEAVFDVEPLEVWAVLTDFGRLARSSPELLGMRPLLPGGLRVGQQYVALNRRKAVVWPTRSVITGLEVGRLLAWDTRSSGARWIWELEPMPDGGTRVVHRRPVPRGLTRLSDVFATVLLGGAASHADELEAAMAVTVERLREAVEVSS